MIQQAEEWVRQAWWHGVGACRGSLSVRHALKILMNSTSGPSEVTRVLGSGPLHILSIGKAAADMAMGATEALSPSPPGEPTTPTAQAAPQVQRMLVITKDGHGQEAYATLKKLLNKDALRFLAASHPLPDARSLQAGQVALDFVASVEPNEGLLLLVSGGASSLCEAPNLTSHPGLDLTGIRRLNDRLLASGLAIDEMNRERARFSRIKAGGLLSTFAGFGVMVLAISDVPGSSGRERVVRQGVPEGSSLPFQPSELAVIGSGIGVIPDRVGASVPTCARIVASNRMARDQAAAFLTGRKQVVRANEESLHGPLPEVAVKIAKQLCNGSTGAYIYGGEPLVVLPDNPGRGGRNQALALTLLGLLEANAGSERQRGASITLLVAGTDGTDGPTEDAGGWVKVSGSVEGADQAGGFACYDNEGAVALVAADSGSWLERAGLLFRSGPTGTNVMDLLVALKARA